MKIWKFLPLLVLAISFSICLSSGALPTVLVTDNQGITGFDFYGSGLYWWDAPGRCTGEFPNDGTIRVRGTVTGSTWDVAQDCTIMQSELCRTVRDEAYFYFFIGRQLYRKAVGATESDPSLLVNTTPLNPTLGPTQDGGTLEHADGYLYFGRYIASTGSAVIYRFKTDGSVAPELLYSIGGVADVKKIKRFRYQDSSAGTIDAIVTLHADGRLYRRKFNGAGTLTLLADRVSDFAVHKRTFLGFGSTTYIYAARGTWNPSPSSPAGSLTRYDADSGGATTIHTASGNNQVLSVATDSDQFLGLIGAPPKYIYITEGTVTCDLFCVISDLVIRRTTTPGNSGIWDLIVNTAGGDNLLSDDDYLYFIRGNSIKRISTDAPPTQLDIEGDALEVVQIVQRSDNSFPLIANRDATYVRGFAHLRVNTTGIGSYGVSARLHAFLNGNEIADSPFQNINNAYIDAVSDLVLLRTNREAGFLFRLPPIPPGTLTMTMTVNPEQSLVETGPSPYNNNTVYGPPVDVVPVPGQLWRPPRPTLMMVTMGTPSGIYNHYSPGFNQIMARAKAMLPVEDIIWYPAQHPFEDFFIQSVFFTDPGNPESDNFALLMIKLARMLSSDPPGSYDVHWVGMIHPGTPSFNGLGYCPGSSVLVRMEPNPNGLLPFDAPRGGRTLAHELGHNYNRKHVNCGSPSDIDDNYPYSPCTIGDYGPAGQVGFDSITRTPLDPTTVGDLMSYAGDRWTSDYTFLGIYAIAALNFPFSLTSLDQTWSPVGMGLPQWVGPGADDPVLLVQGFIEPETGQARLLPFIRFPSGAADALRIQESADAALRAGDSVNPYRLVLADAKGLELVDIPIEAKKPIESYITEESFVQFIPCPPEARVARLVQGDSQLAQRFATLHTPMLSLGPVVLDAVTQTLQLNWSASDSDGDPLLFTLQYSRNNGRTWQTLRLNSTLFSAVVNTDTLPGSTAARLRLMASDGFNTAHAITPPFDLPKHDPVPIISGVLEGGQVSFGSELELFGSAMDPEDGSDISRLRWNLDGPTMETATGSTFLLQNLSPGPYTAQLMASDSDKQTGVAERHFNIAPLVIPDGPTPVLDGKCDTAYRQATYVRIPKGDGSYASTRLLHANGNLYICFTDLELPDLLNPTRIIGLRVDVNADATALGVPGDVGFFVNHNGIPYQEIGTGSGMSMTLTPQLGFSAVIFRGNNSWSAEFRIADSLLDGWNHLVGLMLDHGGPHWPPAATDHAPVSWAETWLGPTVPRPRNRAPIAHAGASTLYSVAEPRLVVLDGSASYDLDGDPLTYTWTQSSGSSVILTNTKSAHPYFYANPASTNQMLTFNLVVNDRSLESAPSETAVTLLPAISGGLLEKAQCVVVGEDVQLRFPGTPGAAYILQATTDFGDWVNLQTNTADLFGAAEFIEHDIGIFPARFYRTLQP